LHLVAKSLGLGFWWIGFSRLMGMISGFQEEEPGLGEDPRRINAVMLVGFAKLKREGLLPRDDGFVSR